jgi:predicted GIY-YIG superfamily endonuclease
MNIGIYKITNPKGKIYIGQSIDIERRFKEYKKLTCKKQPKLYNSLQKYGVENHKFHIIEECFIEQLNEKETYWKKYYLIQFKEDWNNILFCNLYDNGGGPLSKETKLKMSISASGKPKNHGHKISITKMKKVFQYDLNCNFIREFNSVKEAAEYLGVGHGTIISNCCNKSKKNKTAYGYIWKWKDDKSDFSWNIERSSKNIKIFQYDLLGNFIKEYSSVYEASTFLNLDKGTISLCINKKRKTCGGYYFTNIFYETLPFEIYVICQSDIKDNIINYFTSPTEAEYCLRGKNSDNIASCCRGRSQTAYGYKWFIKKIN